MVSCNKINWSMKYAWLTIKHKWFVLLAGLKLKNPPIWRLITHDLSKFGPKQLPYYGRKYFGLQSHLTDYVFAVAWLHHQNKEDHHWEYWIPRTGHMKNLESNQYFDKIPMPNEAIKEMIADWIGASRAYTGEWPEPGNWPWLVDNIEYILENIHSTTKNRLLKILIYDLRYLELTKYDNLYSKINKYYETKRYYDELEKKDGE